MANNAALHLAQNPPPAIRDTEPPCGPSPADLRDPIELPSPRASHHRVLDAALPDLTLAMVFRLLAHVAKPGNGLHMHHWKQGESPSPWHVDLSVTVGRRQQFAFGYGDTAEAAAQAAFDKLGRSEFAGGDALDTHDPEALSDESLVDAYSNGAF